LAAGTSHYLFRCPADLWLEPRFFGFVFLLESLANLELVKLDLILLLDLLIDFKSLFLLLLVLLFHIVYKFIVLHALILNKLGLFHYRFHQVRVQFREASSIRRNSAALIG
jgi:hypothetical protein